MKLYYIMQTARWLYDLPGGFRRFLRLKIFLALFFAENGFARKTRAAERSVSGKGKYHHPPVKEAKKMETNPRDYGERRRLDAFCKTVFEA